MIIKIKRKFFYEKSTISTVKINEEFFCYSLEDKCRGLYKFMNISIQQNMKIYGKTAIPYGTYLVKMLHSPKYGCLMPTILNIPNFGGVMFHIGNTEHDTLGCILLGNNPIVNRIYNSKITFEKFMVLIEKAVKDKEDITVIIEK